MILGYYVLCNYYALDTYWLRIGFHFMENQYPEAKPVENCIMIWTFVDKFAFILSDDFVNVKIYIDVCSHLCSFRFSVTFSISRAISFFFLFCS